jgi:hypothetical protein
VHGQGGGDIDVEPSPLLACNQLFRGTGNTIQRSLYGREIGLSGNRQAYPAAMAFKQCHTQPVFQLLDLAADGTVRHIQGFGSSAETAVTGGGFKGFQCIERGSRRFILVSLAHIESHKNSFVDSA